MPLACRIIDDLNYSNGMSSSRSSLVVSDASEGVSETYPSSTSNSSGGEHSTKSPLTLV